MNSAKETSEAPTLDDTAKHSLRPTIFSQMFRVIRLKYLKGASLQSLADVCGVTHSYLQKVESGAIRHPKSPDVVNALEDYINEKTEDRWGSLLKYLYHIVAEDELVTGGIFPSRRDDLNNLINTFNNCSIMYGPMPMRREDLELEIKDLKLNKQKKLVLIRQNIEDVPYFKDKIPGCIVSALESSSFSAAGHEIQCLSASIHLPVVLFGDDFLVSGLLMNPSYWTTPVALKMVTELIQLATTLDLITTRSK